MGSIRRSKTKRRTRDLDQVHSDLVSPKTKTALLNQKLDESKPGLGQYYCIECAKYFETDFARVVHRRGKNHKRRVRMLKEQPLSQAEIDAAAGVGVEQYMQYVDKFKEQKRAETASVADVKKLEENCGHIVMEQE
ncbi:uncharacterized protein V1518DRAFT_415132 [Limtongia smithiae]|uniref:uncharacterized protein n=1 Tax=Limtongia smithiae TaxID=1125753 RepID=UPI0034CFDC38